MPGKNDYALLIGIGQRSDDSDALAVTATDAKKMAAELEARCGVPKEHIVALTDLEATKDGIIQKLDELIAISTSGKADMIWIYFSGHGCQIPQKEANGYFLICNDTQSADVEKTALSGDMFVGKISQIQSDKMLVLLDCCHSGGMTEFQKPNIPFSAEMLLNQPNRVVLSACDAGQVAFVSTPVCLFTYALIEGLAGKYFEEGDTAVTIFDLAMYVRERVSTLSNRKQQSQLNVLQESSTRNFSIVNYPGGKPATPAFDSAVRLWDGYGKEIDTNRSVESDILYRQQFNWLSVNNINISVDGNAKVGNIFNDKVANPVITQNF